MHSFGLTNRASSRSFHSKMTTIIFPVRNEGKCPRPGPCSLTFYKIILKVRQKETKEGSSDVSLAGTAQR
jgi:hypothetical protein